MQICIIYHLFLGALFKSFGGEIVASRVVLVVKNLSANAGDTRDKVSISGLERSPGGGQCNPLQYSCLEKLRDEELGGLQSLESQRVRHD